MVINPTLATEGFLVLEEDDKKGKLILSYEDFSIGKKFITERGTKVVRTSETEVLLADKIRIPCNKTSITFLIHRIFLISSALEESGRSLIPDLDPVNVPTLTAIFPIALAAAIMETLTGSSFESGFPIHYNDEEKKAGRIVFSLEELELENTFTFKIPVAGETGNKNIVLMHKVSSSEVQLQFKSCPDAVMQCAKSNPLPKKKKKGTGTVSKRNCDICRVSFIH